MTGKGPKQFFTTLPGILTATATLIVAITGLYMALQSGCDKENRQEELGGPASQVSAENQQEELGPTNIQVSAQGGWQSTGVSLTEGQSVTGMLGTARWIRHHTGGGADPMVCRNVPGWKTSPSLRTGTTLH